MELKKFKIISNPNDEMYNNYLDNNNFNKTNINFF